MRVPLVLWDPTGQTPRGPYTGLVQLMDAMATILDLCNVPQPDGSRARSILNDGSDRTEVFADAGLLVQQPADPIPGLRLKAAQPPTAFGPGSMLRTREWKICLYAEDQGELYNLSEDPYEMNNRFDDPDCSSVVRDTSATDHPEDVVPRSGAGRPPERRDVKLLDAQGRLAKIPPQ